MNNHHYSLPITSPNASNQFDSPWLLSPLTNHRTTSLSSYGPTHRATSLNPYGPSSYGFSFRNPYPSLLDRFAHTQSHPMMNPLAAENYQPSFGQTNYNGFLPTGNGHGLGHFFQQPNYNSNSLLVDYLRNQLSIILMGGMSMFDHGYGGYYNSPPAVNPMDYGNFIGGDQSWNNWINPMQLEDERRKYRCVDCGKGFPTTNALGGHRSSHSKMRKKESLRMRIAEEMAAANNTENSAGPSAIRDRPLELEDEVMPSAPPLKIRKIE